MDHVVAPRSPADGTLAARVEAARAATFVGRGAELDLVRELLDQPRPEPAVVVIHGPGGIGKTALLRRVAAEAHARGRRAAFVDGRLATAGPLAFVTALRAALGLPEEADPLGELTAGAPPVLLLDALADLTTIEPWLLQELLPALPEGALTLIGSRQAPSAAWRTTPGWERLTRSVSLRNLPPSDAGRLLGAHGLSPGDAERLVALTYGYPLALTLLSEVVRQGGRVPEALGDRPDVVLALLQRILDEVPSAAHRASLEIAAHARVTTRALLAATVVDGDPDELLLWLHERPYTEVVAGGLVLHDVARDALEAELRWRDPDRYREVHRQIRQQVLARLQGESGVGQREAFADLVHLHRDSPYYAPYTTWNATALRPRTARDDEVAGVAARTAALGFRELAGHLVAWAAVQPAALVVFEPVGGTEVAGATLLLELTAELIGAVEDPVVASAWAAATAQGPLREGECALVARSVLSWERPLEPTAVTDAFDVLIAGRSLAHPQPAWTVLTVPQPAVELWEPQLTYLDWPRIPNGTSWSDTREWVAFGHDWRVTPAAVWLDLMGERELDDDLDLGTVRAARGPSTVVLAREEFDVAVRAALRAVGRPEVLASNPLLRSRVVLDIGGDDPCEALTELLVAATDELRAVPQGAKLHRAVATACFKGAPSQEAAAERLGLPFSTFRRHLNAGVVAISDLLWERELHGPRS